MNFRHVLIATDLSEESLRPFESVSRMALESGAKVTLLHAVQDHRVAAHGAPLAPPISIGDFEADVGRSREELTALRAKLPEEVDVKVDVVVADDVVAKAIVGYADDNDVDLIAVSTHGRTGFRHFVLGSIAEEILRFANVPVLSFPRAKGSE